MKRDILTILSSISLIIFTGCAPKQDDHLAVKTLKHASMTPVYAGAVVNGALALAIGIPVVLAKKAIYGEQHEIQEHESKYEKKKSFKAFVIAVDSKETYTFHYGWSYKTQEEANNSVLQNCEKGKIDRKVNNECILYYIGENKQFELSSKVNLNPSEDKDKKDEVEITKEKNEQEV